jgi:hypothetical protein
MVMLLKVLRHEILFYGGMLRGEAQMETVDKVIRLSLTQWSLGVNATQLAVMLLHVDGCQQSTAAPYEVMARMDPSAAFFAPLTSACISQRHRRQLKTEAGRDLYCTVALSCCLSPGTNTTQLLL